MEDNKLDNLYREFPSLYIRQDGSKVAFDCNQGWYQLLHDLSKELISVIHPDSQVSQVKEKYGTLRFYVDFANDATWDIIEKYENKSGFICEHCGQPGVRCSDGWISTLCEEHRKQRGAVVIS